MATKQFKYGHLYSTTATTAPSTGSMIAGELALGLKNGEEKLWACDGTNIINFGDAIGGFIGDEKTVHKKKIESGANIGKKEFSTLIYLKDVTAEEQAAGTLPSNVDKRYRLVDATGANVVTESGNTSDNIDILKNSSVSEIYLGTVYDEVNSGTGVVTKYNVGDIVSGHTIVPEDFQYLNFVYINDQSEYHMTKINLNDFLTEQEFGSGTTFDNNANKVRGVVDPTTEQGRDGNAFLTVGADGFKVDGIVDEIKKEISDLDATVSGVTSGNHITLVVEELDGKLVQSGFTFEEDNIANADDLAELSAKTVTVIDSSNDSISATSSATADGTVEYDIITDASLIKMSGYTSGGSEDLFEIVASDSVMEAIKKIGDTVISNGDGIASDGVSIEINNTGLLFKDGSAPIVLLGAGSY